MRGGDIDQSKVSGPRFPVVLIAILTLSLGLRLSGLASVPLWMDERFTLGQVDEGLGRILFTGRTAHPPGYALLVLPFRALGGADWTIRIPALLGGLVGVGVAYQGVVSIGYRRLAPYVAMAVATSTYHVYYSQEARGYSWLCASLALCFFMACSHVARPRWASLVGLLATGAFAASFHYFALPSVTGLFGVVLCMRGWRVLGAREERKTSWGAGRVLMGWLVGVLMIALALWTSSERVNTILDFLFLEATTKIHFDLRYLAEAVGRWSGLGASMGAILLPLVGLGLLRLFLDSKIHALLLVALVCGPWIMMAALPWPHRFELRYLIGLQIPFVFLIGLGWAALVELTSRLLKVGNAGAFLAPGLLALIAFQAYPLVKYLNAPRRFTPALTTNQFGFEYVVQSSILEPRMVRSLSREDFATSSRALGPLLLPMPDWPVKPKALRSEGLAILLMNPRADDTLWLELVEMKESGSAKQKFEVERRKRPDGDETGLTYMRASLPDRGLVLTLRFRSSRLEVVDAYFNVVRDSLEEEAEGGR